jgi:hypothetical protein
LGALIGSNITNPLVAIGGGALLSTYFCAATADLLGFTLGNIDRGYSVGYLPGFPMVNWVKRVRSI